MSKQSSETSAAEQSRIHYKNPILDAIISVMTASEFLYSQMNEACSPLNITGVQYNILRVLARNTDPLGISRNDILKQLIEKSVDVTRSIDGLVNFGFVERESSLLDRRVVLHRITEAGKQALTTIDPYFRTMLNAIGENFTNDELESLSALTKKIYRPATK